MPFFTRKPLKTLWSRINERFEIRPQKKHSLGFLNAAQFLGSLNDNIFKLVMVFFLIDTLGKQNASGILSAAGALYVIPFILFSSTAGILADRFSKQKLLVAMKVIEIVVMLLAFAAFGFKSAWGCYALLFVLSLHSATFGPSKYGIIPEIVPKDQIARANGLVTSFTYLAIILGTFFASFLTEVTNRNFLLTLCFCLLVAVLGLFSTLQIQFTPPRGIKKSINFLFLKEVIQTLIFCKSKKHLISAMFGSSFFLFIGSFTQLNIIPFALQSLNLSEVAGGYLFLSTALGIAFGAFLSGRVLKKRIDLGLSCLSALGIALLFFLLFFFSHNLITCIILLLLIGIFGGMFIVPFDSFVQTFSPDEKRGQIIATTNFLSFTGVLISSFCLYLFSNIFGLSSAAGFFLMGIITTCFALIISARLSDYALPFFSRMFLHFFYRVKTENRELLEKSPLKILILENSSAKKAVLLAGEVPYLQLLIPNGKRHFSSITKAFFSLHLIEDKDKLEDLIEDAKKYVDETSIPCLLLDREIRKEEIQSSSKLADFIKRKTFDVIVVKVEKSPWGTIISFRQA